MKASRLSTAVWAAAFAIMFQAGAAHAELKKQWIDYKDGDKPLYGYLVYDDAVSGKRPGVLLAHSRAGMSEATLRDSDMIAKMGYVVFAADIFGKGVLPKEVPEMTGLTTIYNQDRPLMRKRATAGFDVLKASPLVDATKLAVIGYCFGGTVAVELAETGIPIVGTISVHGSFRNFELQLFSGTQHAFTNPQNAAEERADREYKVATPRFLKEVFGTATASK
jgi:dienelactone hydrolase